MLKLIKELWPLQRALVSDGYDEALSNLCGRYPLKINEYKSGEKCWTWTIPEKWTCHEAYVETLSGRRLIDYRDNLLHCVEYSAPVDKVVTREELFKHLFVHRKNQKAIPYVFKFYERDWGFCCSQEQKNKLVDNEYKAVIKTSFEPGKLKVGEWLVPGKGREIFILTAHLCHTYSANDDLSGIVVGLEVMKQLAQIKDNHYTYLFLLVPETIGSIAWLSHNEDLIPRIKSGLFLEMLGNDAPLALQRSYFGKSRIDLCCEQILSEKYKDFYARDFWTIIRNDELEYNSPGVRIPMPSLSRCYKPESESWPYPEYHTNFDTPEIICEERLKDAAEAVLSIIHAYDNNFFPKAKFKGQICCSAYNIFPKTPDKYGPFFKTMFELDGKHSLIDIALKHNLKFEEVLEVIENLRKCDLVEIIRE